MKELTQKRAVHLSGASHWVIGGNATKSHRARSPSPTELLAEEASKLRVNIDTE